MSISPLSAPGTVALESHACDRATAVTKSLLGYLALAGPFYVLVSMAQTLTRTGFSLGRDEWSLLALGHLGWIQMTNLALTGLMVIAGAVGMRRAIGRETADGRWAPRLLAGYGVGLALWPNPVVELNRTVAVAMSHGPQAALAELDKLSGDPRLRDYPYLPAVRAHVLEQAGRHDAARASWLRAAELTRNERERQLYNDHADPGRHPCR